jgi:uncharacterized protein YunC (DUF1805 family)
MLITFDEVMNVLSSNAIHVNCVFHVGAHDCEELVGYNRIGVKNEDIVWVDAYDNKVEQARTRGIPNVYNAVITDEDDKPIKFNVSNNIQSSSVLEFGTHSEEHPHVVYIEQMNKQSITINTFFERNNIDGSKYNFWNFDIQGAELMALKGSTKYIQYVDAMYLEVNEKELYKGCGLIQDIDTFLDQYNFKRVITKMTEHGWGDALYIKVKQ